ncbi:MAG TPA: hypothetical protein VFS00_12595, partial [Polyangiaceae bacterium]|nr:hypothetical protein [Polyangiaceae bacterium]
PGQQPAARAPAGGASDSLYLQTAERYRAPGPSASVVVGARGEGVMPARSLAAFAAFMNAQATNPNAPNSFTDPQGCVSGNFVMGNDPAQP